ASQRMEASPRTEAAAPGDGVEVVDGVPVPAEPAVEPAVGEIEPVRPAGQLVGKHAAAVAVTGFVAAAAAVAALRAARARGARRNARKRNQLVQVVASRWFLVDVHV